MAYDTSVTPSLFRICGLLDLVSDLESEPSDRVLSYSGSKRRLLVEQVPSLLLPLREVEG
jgi:hypothetical protein